MDNIEILGYRIGQFLRRYKMDNIKILIITFLITLFLIGWWTRYQSVTPTKSDLPVVIDRLTGKVWALGPKDNGWIEIKELQGR